MEPGLYLVSTPIGNLGDITLRAIDTLKAADWIVCEDSRRARILLDRYEIRKPLLSLFLGKEKIRTEKAMEILSEGRAVALITDAGTPAIQDPGYLLVRSCAEKGIPVFTVPGPSSITSALSLSGIGENRFVFEGFLPHGSGARKKLMASWAKEERTIIFFESPYRVQKTVDELLEALGDRPIVAAKELTKKFERVYRLDLSALKTTLTQDSNKGEWVFLLPPLP